MCKGHSGQREKPQGGAVVFLTSLDSGLTCPVHSVDVYVSLTISKSGQDPTPRTTLVVQTHRRYMCRVPLQGSVEPIQGRH